MTKGDEFGSVAVTHTPTGAPDTKVEVSKTGTISRCKWMIPRDLVHGEYAFKQWCLHSDDDEPAMAFANGGKHWMNGNVYHRMVGPAIITSDNRRRYFIYGRELTEAEFNFFYPQDK